mmetsp:Transcript_34945/g.57138  ORF Transcript_34945/g.57138 Transcript_34945/m.57138 type:complete len:178 (+) Transcript_34945:135-668(+)
MPRPCEAAQRPLFLQHAEAGVAHRSPQLCTEHHRILRRFTIHHLLVLPRGFHRHRSSIAPLQEAPLRSWRVGFCQGSRLASNAEGCVFARGVDGEESVGTLSSPPALFAREQGFSRWQWNGSGHPRAVSAVSPRVYTVTALGKPTGTRHGSVRWVVPDRIALIFSPFPQSPGGAMTI